MSSQAPRPIYEKDTWEIDLSLRQLRRGQDVVPVGGRSFEIIEILVEKAGETVTKKELMDRVWRGGAVEDNTLQVHIAAVRRAFGNDRDLLETVSGRGYRLVGNWGVQHAGPSLDDGFMTFSPSVTGPASNALSIGAPTRQLGPSSTGPPAQAIETNLPQHHSELIGRQNALRQLRDLLSAYRLVTLTGLGGIGKTRLAIEVSRDLSDHFEHRAQFVELAAIVDPGLVAATIAAALGLQTASREITPTVLASAIGDRHMLLVLDNCEHVIDAAAQCVEAILRRCGRTAILATSRELLRIEHEFVYRVPPLEIPQLGLETVDTALSHGAIALFSARVRAGKADFDLSGANLASVVAVCRRLDGIPLAIELAAARAATLGIEEVVSRLDDRFGILTGRRRTALPRHQTLRAMLDWSYHLLPEDERHVLNYLAVFAGGFTLEAAVAVAAALGAETQPVVDGIVSLTTKSLIGVEHGAAPLRYTMLETVRAYALDKLAEATTMPAARLRHAQYFQALFRRADAERGSRPVTDWLALYDREIDNVRVALDWAFSVEAGILTAVALSIDAIPMLFDLSLIGEGRRRVEQALSALGSDAQVPERWEMQLLAILQAMRIYTDGPSEAGFEAWRRVYAIATQLGDLDYQIRALWGLWNDHLYGGWPQRSLGFAQQFMMLAATRTDQATSITATVLGPRIIGTALHYCGDQDAAHSHLVLVLSHYDRSAHRWRVLGSRLDQATVTRATFARVQYLQGFSDRAAELAAAALRDATADGHLMSILYVLVETSLPLALCDGDFVAGRRLVGTLLDQAQHTGFRIWLVAGQCFQAALTIASEDPATGVRRLTDAVQVLEETGFCTHLTAFLGLLAGAQAATGAVAEARQTVERALGWCKSHGEHWFTAELLRIKADILGDGLEDASVACLHQALDLARRQGAMLWELRAATSLARRLQRAGQPGLARDVLAPVHDRFTEGFGTTDLRAARAVLQALPAG